MIVQTDAGAQNLVTMARYLPPASVRNFGDKSAHMQALEQAPRCGALPTPFLLRFPCRIQLLPDVTIAKAVHQMLALQDRAKPCHVFVASRIETCKATLADNLRLSQLTDW